ncbi:M48 family metallopeptidase [Methylopila sp. 73B]|uniref:M48 family metallopeptidase n=1 Tax=Methylopila sp. 73B TaxID=1120792 RepID=UPI00036C8B2F|nr:M48 family metallopeptidase [Methylopila sp. 73B]
MGLSGPASYFDGVTSRRRSVLVALDDTGLRLSESDGAAPQLWPYSLLREIAGPPGALRLSSQSAHALARLDVRDAALAAAIRARAPSLGAGERAERGLRRRVALWGCAAAVSAGLFAVYGLPALADRIAPLLPWSVDQRMGEGFDAQIRFLLPTGDGDFECGADDGEAAGKAALDALSKKLSDAAALPAPLKIVAVRSSIPNAFALPGGYIYLFDGLIREAETPDEIAGVLAHEIGHVAHRDGSRRVLQASGLSFLFGFVLGDFSGGAATIFVARVLSEASYSRAAESGADLYAVRLMRGIGADPRALGTMLDRLVAESKSEDGAEVEKDRDGRSALDYLSSHPAVAERRRAIDAAAGDAPATPALDAAAFAALKTICGPAKADEGS